MWGKEFVYNANSQTSLFQSSKSLDLCPEVCVLTSPRDILLQGPFEKCSLQGGFYLHTRPVPSHLPLRIFP